MLNIKRWWQSLGFGIQSKTDFAFLKDVIKEQHPYYAYEYLRQQFPNASQQQTHQAQLIFRIINHLRPSDVVTLGTPSKLILAHINAASKGEGKPLIYIEGEAKLPHSHGYSAIIINNINNTNANAWKQVLCTNAVTYDAKTIGIAIFYPNRTPEHYKI
ncbi:MAG: hypothetical protein KBT34_01370 [Prevotella sp.]|nr:hypothetical protein [Candidatus Prevotella equi]